MARLLGIPDETFAAMQRIRETALIRFDSLFTPERKLWVLPNLRLTTVVAYDSFTAWRGGFWRLERLSGQVTTITDGVTFDPASGRISFPNPRGLKFVPMTSALSANGVDLTESCYTKSIGANFFRCRRDLGWNLFWRDLQHGEVS
jgi:hypothetical protein